MAQRNIDFGTFPDDPDADAIRTAFEKTQQNFTELFAGLDNQGVLSVNKTPGAGISVFPITGNVVVSANIACVTVQSSTLDVSLTPNTTGNLAVMTDSSSQSLYINLPSNITSVNNASFAGTVTANTIAANAAVTSSNTVSAGGNITGGNLVTGGTLTVVGNANVGNIGGSSGVFVANVSAGNVYANSGTISGAAVTATGNVTGNNANITNNVSANIVTANFLYGDGSNISNVTATPGKLIINANTEINIPSPNSSIFMSVAGTANVLVVNQTSVNVAGILNATGNLISANANLGNAARANYFIGNFYGTANSATTATSATTAGTVTTAAQPNITSVGTLSALTVTGKVTAGQLQGDGGNISNIQGANVSGTVANATYATNAGSATTATSATTAGTVTTNAQPNITSVGTLSSLAVTANITAGNVYANSGIIGANLLTGTLTTAAQPNVTSVGTLTSLTVSGKVTAGQLQGDGGNISNIQGANVSGAVSFATTANAVAGANVSGQVANALIAGTVYTAAQPNITSVGTLTGLGVNGNLTASNITANTGVFTGNASGLTNIPGSNVSGAVANATYATNAGTAGTATTAGTVTTNAQPNITSVGTLSSLSITGNLSSGNANLGNLVKANYFQGDGSLLTNISVGAGSYIVNGNSEVRVDANSNVRITVGGNANVLTVTGTGANISGNLSAGNISATLMTGTLATAAQPNVTSLGNLSSLNVDGVTNLGVVGNVKISGGSNNQVLVSTGAGSNLAFITATSLTTAPGSNTQVLFNDAGSFQANANLTFDKSTGLLSTNAVSATGSGTFGNVYANSGTVRGNLLTGTLTTAAQPNITSIGTLTSLIVNGNINAGNISGGNLVSANYLSGTLVTAAQPNITSIGTLGSLTVTNKVTAGQLQGEGGNISNVQGTNVSGAVANATYATSAGSATTATTAGTVTTNAQPNITSVGTLTALTVNGNATTGKLTVNPAVATSNVHALTILQTWNNSSVQFSAIEANITDTASAANSLLFDLQISNVSKFAVSKEGNIFYSGVITGNGSGLSSITGANVTGTVANATYATSAGSATTATSATSATTAGTVTTNAQPNITSVGTLTSLAVTGNVSAGNVSGTLLTGTLTTAAQPNITTVGTLTSLGVNGTITGVNITANTGVFTGNGSGLSAIVGANVTGTVANATSAGSATTAGTVTTAAQPNITSVGTLTNLTVSGNINTSTGNITGANLISSSYVIRSVGTGISAAGTVQGDATAITKEMNVVSTVASGTGVRLPTAVAGMAITIINTSANALLVYPHSGGDINSAATNAAYSQPAGATLQFVAPTTTDWYTVGATFA